MKKIVKRRNTHVGLEKDVCHLEYNCVLVFEQKKKSCCSSTNMFLLFQMSDVTGSMKTSFLDNKIAPVLKCALDLDFKIFLKTRSQIHILIKRKYCFWIIFLIEILQLFIIVTELT